MELQKPRWHPESAGSSFTTTQKGLGLANQISIFRILLSPVIVASLLYYDTSRDFLRYFTLALFILGILSDAADGFIARTQNQRTELGTILDPIADKCLVLSTLISFATIHALPDWMRVPAWFNLIVISRDIILIAGTIIIFGITGTISVKPSWLGKCTVVSQMLVVPIVLLRLPFKEFVLTVAGALTIISGIGYIRTGAKSLAKPS